MAKRGTTNAGQCGTNRRRPAEGQFLTAYKRADVKPTVPCGVAAPLSLPHRSCLAGSPCAILSLFAILPLIHTFPYA